MQRATAKGFRLHIGFFGRRNVGKSSLLNAITQQKVSIVSDVPGTTTDPVEKPMELQPIGPVLFVDTAGVDDVGALGAQRIEKTRQVIARADIGVMVTEAGVWGEFEDRLLAELRAHNIPVVVALNKADLCQPTTVHTRAPRAGETGLGSAHRNYRRRHRCISASCSRKSLRLMQPNRP